MNDLAVSRAGVHANFIFPFQDNDTLPSPRDSAGNGKPDYSGAHDNRIDFIRHFARIPAGATFHLVDHHRRPASPSI
jgi:hypothetical protein